MALDALEDIGTEGIAATEAVGVEVADASQSDSAVVDVTAPATVTGGQSSDEPVNTGGVTVVPLDENGAIDMSYISDEDRAYIIEHQGKLPPHLVRADAVEKDGVTADAQDKQDKQDKASSGTDDADEKVEAKEETSHDLSDIEKRINEFKFTEDADEETRAKEEAEYLEMVELPEPLQKILEAKDARLAELQEKVSALPDSGTVDADPAAKRHAEAFDRLVTYTQDESGVPVPDTSAFLSLLEEEYPKEAPALIWDFAKTPSVKYQGYTRFQEVLKDGFGLTPESIQEITGFLERGGTFNFPKFVPENLSESLAEAYWTSPDREDIAQQIDSYNYTLQDALATEFEKAEARRGLQAINQRLKLIQDGINVQHKQRQELAEAPVRDRREIETQTFTNYAETATSLLSATQADLEKAFGAFDKASAKLNAAAFAQLLQNSLSEGGPFAKLGREALTKNGIKVDWSRSVALLDSLYEVETALVVHKRNGAHDRTIRNTQARKAEIIRELTAMSKEFIGQAASKLVKGANAAVQKTAESAPAVQVVKPKLKAAGASTDHLRTDFARMSPEERRSRIGEMINLLQAQGQAVPKHLTESW